jgi:hypothetical protein
MNTHPSSVDTLDAGLPNRVVRTAAGFAAVGVVVADLALHPAWIFALSTLCIYLIVSAILGVGLSGLFHRTLDRLIRDEDDSIGYELNVGGGDRLARGAAAAVVFGSIVGGISVSLDPLDYFLWTLVGLYTGMSAVVAWDPAYRLLNLSTRRHHPAVHAAPDSAHLMQPGIADVIRGRGAAARRAA